MNIHVLPGQIVIAYFRHGNVVRTLPHIFSILGVSLDELTVADPRSENGLATICCTPNSRGSGTYSFEYDTNTLKIVRLEDAAGKQIAVQSFIQS